MKTKIKKCKICGDEPAAYSNEAGCNLCIKHQTRLVKKKIALKKAALLALATACIALCIYFL